MALLDGIKVAMLGGDEREVILARGLIAQGAQVTVVGYPEHVAIKGARRVRDVTKAVHTADVVVAPMGNTDADGIVYNALDPTVRLPLDKDAFAAMGAGKPLFIGAAKPVIEMLSARYKVRLIRTADVDEIAILNSIPTAEGAIARAMEQLPVTLHGSQTIVVGFGRCGLTLTRMLQGIGARVKVVARDGGQLARAHEMGLQSALLDATDAFSGGRAVFNTVPARVLTRERLEQLPPGAVIVDIASAPGGTDFTAAKELGLKAFLDTGIPGRVAPETAGEILAQTMPRLIWDECRRVL